VEKEERRRSERGRGEERRGEEGAQVAGECGDRL